MYAVHVFNLKLHYQINLLFIATKHDPKFPSMQTNIKIHTLYKFQNCKESKVISIYETNRSIKIVVIHTWNHGCEYLSQLTICQKLVILLPVIIY